MNPGLESEEVELRFAKAGGANILDAYETSKANDLTIVSRGVKNNRYRFPSESVTTLVIKLPPLMTQRSFLSIFILILLIICSY